MSPLPLRRYRAERLLREEFGSWRARVLAAVRVRLRTNDVRLDAADLEACYAQAWAGLYAELLGGREVANPVGWLTVVTYRRALDEHRSRTRERLADMLDPGPGAPLSTTSPAAERDLPAELDDRAELRHVFEAFRGRLSERECEAAALCYLQGLPRAEAAARMGIGEQAMRKLMEGHGAGRPGVASKVGGLLGSIRGGEWCEQQASLMRAFAFGVLDPDGERYRLALAHRRECPACRRYVLSLRGLAAVLPPLALPWGVGAGVGAGAGSAAGAGSGTGAGTGVGLGGGIGGGKLAVSCVLVLGVGCGAIAGLPNRSGGSAPARRGRHAPLLAGAPLAAPEPTRIATRSVTPPATGARRLAAASIARAGGSRSAAGERAQREFGPERSASSRQDGGPGAGGAGAGAGGAGAGGAGGGGAGGAGAGGGGGGAAAARGAGTAGAAAATARAASTGQGATGTGGASRAEREFGP
jgi:DNA-directed RNA polymerase specialized sigma24 family protein